MNPAQIHNYLTTLTANAAKQLADTVPASPFTPGGGKAKGKGKGKDADTAAAKPSDKMPSQLTAGNLGKAAGAGPPPGRNTPAASEKAPSDAGSVNSAKSSGWRQAPPCGAESTLHVPFVRQHEAL